ncbi:hypothetical protein ACRAWD_12020 [Caulobacter segnis]
MAMLGADRALGALKKMRQRLDPSRVNGAPLLGLNGIVVKSHGGADAGGFASAVPGRHQPRAQRFPRRGRRKSQAPDRRAAKDEAPGAGPNPGVDPQERPSERDP